MLCLFYLCFLMFISPFNSNIEEGDFSIYLPAEKIPLEKVYQCDIDINLQKIKLKNDPIIDDCDLISYLYDSHTMELKPKAWEKLMKVKRGSVFIVCVGKTPIYWGIIWSSLLSVSCKSITIVKPGELKLTSNWRPDNYLVRIQCGYPAKAYFKGKDLRSDRRIIEALKKSGKLIE